MRIILFILVALSACPLFGQFGMDTDYWDFQKSNEVSKAAVRLEVVGLMGSSHGSGSIIQISDTPHKDSDKMHKAYLLTASHVLTGQAVVKVRYQGGGDYSGTIIDKVTIDVEADLAIMTVYAPKNYNILPIGSSMEVGEDVYITGYGGPSNKVEVEKPRFFRSKIARIGKDLKHVIISCDVIAGDSGGPITNSKGEVIGVVSGGIIWCCDKKLNHPITWPTRSGSFVRIKELLEKHKESGK